jgi:hypothetical protein
VHARHCPHLLRLRLRLRLRLSQSCLWNARWHQRQRQLTPLYHKGKGAEE